MGRKKVLGANEAPEVAESTPFYYCDREFDDVKTLVHHQRTKHFCCGECGRTFGSVTSLRVHMLNSYKKSLKEVPHAMSGRENPDVVVHGMDGLPQDILEERIQKSKADADDKREEEKERSKGAPKVDPSSPASKSLPPTAMPSTSPEPQSGQKQAASPETGNRADLPLEPPTPSQKLEENVDAAVTSLPPALKLLVPELLEETPQCEGLPDALASLHSIAVQALASFGLLQPGSYGANKMDAALQAAVAAVKQPTKPSQAQPAMLDVPSAALGPTVSLPVGFAPVAAQPASQPLRPLGPAPMGCFPAQFPPMQGGPMAMSLGPGRPPSAVPNTTGQARPPGYVPGPQTMACGCAAQPMQLPFGVQAMGMGMPAVGGRQIGGAPTMPLGGIALPTQLPNSGIAGMEPAEKRAKMDVA